MQTETQDTARTSPDEDDELLRERVGTCIAEACGGDMPDGVAVHVVDRRVTLTDRVEDIDLSQRLEKCPPPRRRAFSACRTSSTTRVPAHLGAGRPAAGAAACARTHRANPRGRSTTRSDALPQRKNRRPRAPVFIGSRVQAHGS